MADSTRIENCVRVSLSLAPLSSSLLYRISLGSIFCQPRKKSFTGICRRNRKAKTICLSLPRTWCDEVGINSANDLHSGQPTIKTSLSGWISASDMFRNLEVMSLFKSSRTTSYFNLRNHIHVVLIYTPPPFLKYLLVMLSFRQLSNLLCESFFYHTVLNTFKFPTLNSIILILKKYYFNYLFS